MRYVGQSYELTIPLSSDQGARTKDGVGDVEDGADFTPPVSRLTPHGSYFTFDISRLTQAFHSAHYHRFSYASQGEPVEIVTVRLKAVGRTPKPQFCQRPSGSVDPKAAHIGHKQVYFDAGSPQGAQPILAALYDRGRLACGNIVVGPAIVFQLDTTTVLPPVWSATVDGWGNLVVECEVA
jgi:N-methylhydantoinase A